MDKYTLLAILNIPFVIFGLIKAFVMFKEGTIQRLGLIIRLIFWGIVFSGLVFAEAIYNFAFSNNLTDTEPLSLADVALVTGILMSFTLIIRLYAKTENLEKRLSDLHEEISILESTKD